MKECQILWIKDYLTTYCSCICRWSRLLNQWTVVVFRDGHLKDEELGYKIVNNLARVRN
jgi:hypothetical protein